MTAGGERVPPPPGLTAGQYDELWRRDWAQMQALGPVHRHTRRLILELAAEVEFASVLDVGCGSGELLADLARRWPDALLAGMDHSPVALARARRRLRGEWQCGDIARAAPAGRFDLVLCSQVLEHIPDDRAAIGHLRAATARAAIVTSICGRMRRSEHAIGHVRNYRRGELEARMVEAGFAVRRAVYWGFPFYSPLFRSAVEWLPRERHTGRYGWPARLAAELLHRLYRLNWPGRGDLVFLLAEAV